MKILVVDDSKEFCESILDVLELEGYTATATHDGLSTIALVEKDPPDLVLMDMVLPGIDGLETFRRIKALAPQLPVIIMSGFSIEDRIGGALQEGIDAFLHKPLNFPKLFDLIEARAEADKVG